MMVMYRKTRVKKKWCTGGKEVRKAEEKSVRRQKKKKLNSAKRN